MKRFSLKKASLIVIFSVLVLELFPQSFTEQTGITLAGISNGSTTWGDYDNDGDLDLLVSGSNSTSTAILQVFRNDGSNIFSDPGLVFSPAIPYTYVNYAENLLSSWIDFNNDSFLDIIMCGNNLVGGYDLLIYQNGGSGTFTFKYKFSFMTFQGGSAFDCGDYDNDGDFDILVTTSIASKILSNQGNFVFSEQSSIDLQGVRYSSAKLIDYDLDSDMDIMLTGNGISILYQNQGNNSFVKQSTLSFVGSDAGSNDWGDYNNDGYPDLLITGTGSYIYKNNGNNTFTIQVGFNLPFTRNALGKWGDLDNDGDLDFILAGNNDTSDIANVYLNNGDNTFTEATSIVLTGISNGSAGFGDYDNDGDLDIIISGMNGPLKICKVYKNTSSVVNPVPPAPDGLTVVSSGNDIILKWNRVKTDNTPAKAITYNVMAGIITDGIDLVNPNSLVNGFRKVISTGNSQYDTSLVLKNIKKATYKWKVQAIDNSFKGGAFSLESSFTYSSSFQAYSLYAKKIQSKVVNLNWSRGNGDNCIIFMKMAASGTAAPVNSSTYTASPVFGSGTQIGSTGWYCVYKGSLNSASVTGLTPLTDYVVQVLEFSGTPGNEIYYNQISVQNSIILKTGLFTDINNASLKLVYGSNQDEVQPSEVSWLDFDNDNDLDLFVIGYNGYFLFQNNGNNVFTNMSLTLNNMGEEVKCIDFNNDGFIDITTINGSGTFIYVNNGNNTFSELTGTSISGASSASIDWGDYDNDGDLDLFITGELGGAFDCIAKIYRNNGNSTFTEMTNHNLPGIRIGNTDWGDYNNDGYFDLLMCGIDIDGGSLNSVFGNDGKGSFVKVNDLGSGYMGVEKWGDYDNDGDLDILLVSSSTNKIFRNEGNNTFTTQTQISLGSAMYGFGEWGDYDNDGYLDIILGGYKDLYIPYTKIYRNNQDNTFSEDLNCALTPAGGSKAAWGDYDKDGDLDVLLMGVSLDSAFTKLYRNDISILNQVPAAPTGVTSVVTKSDVILTWESVRTDNTGYKGITYNIKIGTLTGGINTVTPHSASTGYRRLVDMGNANLDTTFQLKNLPFGTYYWRVQAIDNGFSGSPFSVENSFSVVPVQATNLTARILASNSLLLKWERGNGTRCIVFCREGSTGISVPVNNKSYVMDSELGFGEQIGTTGWYCVYNGRDDSVTVTGLKYKTDYSFHVVEYLGGPGTEQYFTELVNGNPGIFSTGLFSEQTSISLTTAGFNTYAWGDYNNDGFSDILIPGPSTKLYRNNSDNSFIEVTPTPFQNSQFGGAYWGDYDNDGDLDALITGGTTGNRLPGYSKIYSNDGSDIFTEQTQILLPGVYSSSAAWGDYDSDGDLDIIIAGATGDDPFFNPITKIYSNNGNNTFTAMDQIVLPGVYRGDVKWVDYDSDGDLDIHLSGATDYQYWLNAISKIYRNEGNNTFTLDTGVQFDGLWEASSDWADFDNDGDMDVAMTKPGLLTVYRNDGNSSFMQVLVKGYGYSSFGSVRWGDYNNDGFIDILFSNFAAAAIIFKNNNGLSFTESNDGSFIFTQVEGLEWCDYDNDGDIDVMVYRWGYNCQLYRNNLNMKSGLFKTNRSPSAPTGLDAENTATGVILKWNPVSLDETTSKTMSYNVRVGTSKTSFNIRPPHSSTTGYREIPAIGNAQLDTTYRMINMPALKYYWSVQAVDQGLKGGAWSLTDSVDVKNVLSFFSSDTVCLGLSTKFTNQSVAFGDVIQSYKWLFGDGALSTLASPSHLFSSAGVKNVTLITYSATTSDTITNSVLVKAKPIVNFSASVACQGSETVLQNLSDVTGLTISSWSWDYGDGKGSTVQNPGTHGYLTAGDYQLTLTAAADNLCSSFITKTVSVGAYPVASISASTPLSFCSGDSVSLSVIKIAGYTYKWLAGGVYLPGQDSSEYVAKSTGIFTAEVVNPTGNCKTTSATAPVTVLNAPSAPTIISGKTPAVFCQGDSVSLSVTNTTGYTYSWKLNGGSVGSDKNEYFAKNSGTYTLIVANSTGCLVSASNFINVVVNALPAVSAVTPGGATTFCEGGNVTLSVTPNTGNSYYWSNETGPISNATTNSYTASTTGKYDLTVTNSSGCVTKTSSVNVTVKPMPSIPLITSSNYVTDQCPPLDIKVRLSTQEVTGYSYQWLKNGIAYSNRTLSYIEENLTQGVYAVETLLDGCKTVSDNFNISYAAAPEKPEILVKGPVVWYMATSKNSYKQYKWYFNDELIQGAVKYIYVANKKLGTYRVEVADENSCFTSSNDVIIPVSKSGMTDFNVPAEYLAGEGMDAFGYLNIYPNPSSGIITIEMDNELTGDLMISILTIDGKEIINHKAVKSINNYSDRIDLTGYSKGHYYLKIELNNIISVKKIILE